MPDGYDSPEAAAMEGFPAKYCHVVAIRVNGDEAYVLLDTGPAGRPYLYGVNCGRRGGRWFGGASGNGPSWSLSDERTGLGTLSVWDEAPPAADRVRVEYDGQVIEEPVREGAYLVVFWNRPSDFKHSSVAFRINGEWIDWGR
ncbi:MAG TPA: hypothetical protein VH679_15810 [Vicinamibacterales bacterium]